MGTAADLEQIRAAEEQEFPAEEELEPEQEGE